MAGTITLWVPIRVDGLYVGSEGQTFGSPMAFPQGAGRWFEELLRLEHVPFHYLVPREEMLPTNSLRFIK